MTKAIAAISSFVAATLIFFAPLAADEKRGDAGRMLMATRRDGEPPEVVRRLLPSGHGYERLVIKTDAAFWKRVAATAGLGAISIKEKTLTIFRAREDFVVFTAARGMHGPVYMAVAVGRGLHPDDRAAEPRVKGVEILAHGEIAGSKITDDGFLQEFKGRGLPLRFSPASDAITGATVSSMAVAEGVRKALAIVSSLEI